MNFMKLLSCDGHPAATSLHSVNPRCLYCCCTASKAKSGLGLAGHKTSFSQSARRKKLKKANRRMISWGYFRCRFAALLNLLGIACTMANGLLGSTFCASKNRLKLTCWQELLSLPLLLHSYAIWHVRKSLRRCRISEFNQRSFKSVRLWVSFIQPNRQNVPHG